MPGVRGGPAVGIRRPAQAPVGSLEPGVHPRGARERLQSLGVERGDGTLVRGDASREWVGVGERAREVVARARQERGLAGPAAGLGAGQPRGRAQLQRLKAPAQGHEVAGQCAAHEAREPAQGGRIRRVDDQRQRALVEAEAEAALAGPSGERHRRSPQPLSEARHVGEDRGAAARVRARADQPDGAAGRGQPVHAVDVICDRVPRVEHERPDVRGMARGVDGHQVGPIRAAEQIEALDSDRFAHGIHVVSDGGVSVRPDTRTQLAAAGTDGGGHPRRRREAGRHLRQRAARDRVRAAGAAGVDQQEIAPVAQQPVAVQHRGGAIDQEAPGNPRDDRSKRRPRRVATRHQSKRDTRRSETGVRPVERDADAAAPRLERARDARARAECRPLCLPVRRRSDPLDRSDRREQGRPDPQRPAHKAPLSAGGQRRCGGPRKDGPRPYAASNRDANAQPSGRTADLRPTGARRRIRWIGRCRTDRSQRRLATAFVPSERVRLDGALARARNSGCGNSAAAAVAVGGRTMPAHTHVAAAAGTVFGGLRTCGGDQSRTDRDS